MFVHQRPLDQAGIRRNEAALPLSRTTALGISAVMTRTFSPLAAFTHAVKSTWQNRAYAFHLSWPWMLLMLPLQYMQRIYVEPIFAVMKPGDVPTAEQISTVFSTMTPFILGTVFSLASLAVNWHRFILKDETAVGLKRLRLDRPVFRYVGNLFMLVFLMVVVLLLPMTLLAFAIEINPALSQLFLTVVTLLATAYSFRLSLKFPAIAVERMDYGFAQGLKDTAGHTIQIAIFVALIFMAAAGLGFLVYAVSRVVTGIDPTFGFWAEFLLNALISWVTTIFGITVLTTLYGYFVEGRKY
jgi:hypothetical protein